MVREYNCQYQLAEWAAGTAVAEAVRGFQRKYDKQQGDFLGLESITVTFEKDKINVKVVGQ